jgi:hypothetical protein
LLGDTKWRLIGASTLSNLGASGSGDHGRDLPSISRKRMFRKGTLQMLGQSCTLYWPEASSKVGIRLANSQKVLVPPVFQGSTDASTLFASLEVCDAIYHREFNIRLLRFVFVPEPPETSPSLYLGW